MKYRNCSSDRSIKHQTIFENSLLEAMAVRNYSDITVTDISRHAGLSRKSFYHYFDGKDGCLKALVDHTIQNFHSHEAFSLDQRLSQVDVLCYWKEQHRLIDALYRNHMIDMLLNRILFFATVEDGFRTYVAWERQEYPREQIVLLVGGLYAVLLDWYLSGYEKDPQELGENLEKLLTQLR